MIPGEEEEPQRVSVNNRTEVSDADVYMFMLIQIIGTLHENECKETHSFERSYTGTLIRFCFPYKRLVSKYIGIQTVLGTTAWILLYIMRVEKLTEEPSTF